MQDSLVVEADSPSSSLLTNLLWELDNQGKASIEMRMFKLVNTIADRCQQGPLFKEKRGGILTACMAILILLRHGLLRPHEMIVMAVRDAAAHYGLEDDPVVKSTLQALK